MAPEPHALTFLFTDIEGSTRLWERHGTALGPLLAWHDRITGDAVQDHGGELVKRTGDGLHAVFVQPGDALRAVIAIQAELGRPMPPAGLGVPEGAWPLALRCGLHRGPSEARDGDYFGTVPNRAARIMAVGHGGQVLLSQAVADALGAHMPEGARLRDLGAVRLRDLARPETVYQLVHPRLRAEFPPLRSLEATPNNLPQQLDSFIGREAELAELRRLLARERLVTLLGMGGIGKSRLSVQLGADVLDRFPDGVWLVELAPLSDPRLLPQAVARVLGLREVPGAATAEALAAHLRDRRMLLLLDNCEHLVEAAAALAQPLLQAAPGLHVLATSRDPLHLPGEAVVPIAPLPVPTPPDAGAQAAGSAPWTGADWPAAVRLFVDRATAADPRFRLTPANAVAVADVCRLLDGIPLALELAAARTRAIAPDTLARRLRERFDFALIGGGSPHVPPRQRTLRALIDWSHDLLNPAERALFRQLSVFAGGWTLEAAEALCQTDPLFDTAAAAAGEAPPPRYAATAAPQTPAAEAPAPVWEVLAQLVDRSLVVLDRDSGRYRMLDTVRRYAAERLAQADEAPMLHARHLAQMVALAEAARAQLAGPNQAQWLARLDDERDNLLAAHGWCRASSASSGFDALAVRLLHALRPYAINRGAASLVYGMATDVLARPGLATRDTHRCMALFAAGQVAFLMGQHSAAHQHLAECLAIARERGDDAIAARTLQPLGMNALARRDFADAERHLRDALALARAQAEPREHAAALTALAMLHRMQRRPEQAAPLGEAALALLRGLGDLENIGIALLNLAMVSIEAGALAAVPARLREVLALVRETGSQHMLAGLLDACCGLAIARHDAGWASALHACADAHRRDTGLSRDPADQDFIDRLCEQAPRTVRPSPQGLWQSPGPLPHGDGGQRAALADALAAWLDGQGQGAPETMAPPPS